MSKVMKMKRLLVIGLTTIIIACSGSEKPQVQDQECFSTGEKTIKWTMVTTWPKISLDSVWVQKISLIMLTK
jgi:hypothetical protein